MAENIWPELRNSFVPYVRCILFSLVMKTCELLPLPRFSVPLCVFLRPVSFSEQYLKPGASLPRLAKRQLKRLS